MPLALPAVQHVPVLYTPRQFTSWLARRPGPRDSAPRIIVCGDRRWTAYDPIVERLLHHTSAARAAGGPDPIIIQGQALGADTIARDACQVLGLSCVAFPAQWDQHGKKAGPLRNEVMLACRPHLVLAFHRALRFSRGTRQMCRIAYDGGVPIEVHTGTEIKYHDPAVRSEAA